VPCRARRASRRRAGACRLALARCCCSAFASSRTPVSCRALVRIIAVRSRTVAHRDSRPEPCCCTQNRHRVIHALWLLWHFCCGDSLRPCGRWNRRISPRTKRCDETCRRRRRSQDRGRRRLTRTCSRQPRVGIPARRCPFQAVRVSRLLRGSVRSDLVECRRVWGDRCIYCLAKRFGQLTAPAA
jgi:hypothetical protein